MKRKEHVFGKNKIFVEHLIPDKFEDSAEGERDIFEHPVIFIHGAFTGYYIWQKMISYFAENGFECFALSLRGHKSSGGDLEGSSLQDYVDDVRSLVEEFDLKDPILVGHSMGGLLAFLYTREFTEDVGSLIALDPALPQEAWDVSIDESTVENFGEVVSLEDVGAPTSYYEASNSLPDVSPEYLIELDSKYGKESGKAWKEILRGVSMPEDAFGSVPVLLVGVEFDDTLPFSIPSEKIKKMAEMVNGDFFAVKGTSHVGVVIGENCREISDAVIGWLKKSMSSEFKYFNPDEG